jgi:WD40 repeat protein
MIRRVTTALRRRGRSRAGLGTVLSNSAQEMDEDQPTTIQDPKQSVQWNEQDIIITPLHVLPTEIMVYIFGNLNLNELYRVSLVCRHFYLLVQDELLWKGICCSLSSSYSRKLDLERGWKKRVKDYVHIQKRWKKGEFSSVQTFASPSPGDRIWALQMDEEKIVSGSTGFWVRIWNLKKDEDAPQYKNLRGHTKEVRCLQYIDNVLVSGGYDGQLIVWDLAKGECVRRMEMRGDVMGLAFDKERIVSASRDAVVRVWDLESGKCFLELSGHSNTLRAVKRRRRQGCQSMGHTSGDVRSDILRTYRRNFIASIR